MWWLIPTVITVASFGYWTYMIIDSKKHPDPFTAILGFIFFLVAAAISGVSWLAFWGLTWLLG